MNDDPKNQDPTRCAAPHFDPTQRSMMPMGLLAMVALVVVWAIMALITCAGSIELLLHGKPVSVEVVGGVDDHQEQAISFVDADGRRQSRTLRLPEQAAMGSRVELLRSGDRFAQRAGVISNVSIAVVMLVFTMVPLLIGRGAWRRLREDREHMQRLRRATRSPVLGVRVERETPQRSMHQTKEHDYYRVWARFAHPDGRRYLAPSELLPIDPGVLLDADRIRVLIDRLNPLQCLIDEATLPSMDQRLALRSWERDKSRS